MRFIDVLRIALAACSWWTTSDAFSFQNTQQQQYSSRAVDIEETAPRDVLPLQEWAQNCGVQMVDGFELTSQDGEDWSAYTTQDIPAGSPVLYVPSFMVLCSSAIESELGGSLEAAENALLSEGNTDRMPLFRLIVKILAEIENGYDSPFLPWLNALPRRFYNGVAMTNACFECLPPYAASITIEEWANSLEFAIAIQQGYLELSEDTLEDPQLVKWAYNVALTRHKEVWTSSNERTKKIAPLVDMLNHATNSNTVIQYDDEGNCWVTATQDIPAGSPLTVSLTEDPTNPTLLFAKYGFLCDDSPAIFCKAIHLEDEIKDLGYEFSELLFDTQTGDVAPKVWDIFLYNYLKQQANKGEQEAFKAACRSDDGDTKQSYHQHYFSATLAYLSEFVNRMLGELDTLNTKAESYDLETHPRVPVIVAHNTLAKNTFWKVKGQLDSMG